MALRVELQFGMTQSAPQGPSDGRRLLCSLYAHLSPLCCFSTALLTPSIHSRPKEPAELRESTATQGIYGNLKILTSAIVRYTQCRANSLRPTPTNLLFPLRLSLMHLMAFPDHTFVCFYFISFIPFYLSLPL